MNKLKFILFLCVCFISISLFSQQNTGKKNDAMILVKVVVVDKQGDPLPGASVKVSGKAQGVISDEKGRLSLWVDRNSLLVFSYIGMQQKSIKVTKPLSGVITLEDNVVSLDQVVVTGYTRTTKRRTTGSLATLSEKDLKTAPMANIDMLLQGKIAGVDVKAISGRPGETAKIRIRGTNTITGNAEPLWVVDGVPLQRDIPKISSNQIKANDFNDIFSNGIAGINPNDIENVTVLKDASAAAIYGSRAAGGVIVITTKRGKEGKMNISYSANMSIVTSPPHNADLMNSKEKLAWEQELWNEFSQSHYANGEKYPVVGIVGMIRAGYGKYRGMTGTQQDAEIANLGAHTTDWFKELFQNSISQSHYLSFSGGSNRSTYYVSLGVSQNNGLVKKTNYDRYNMSAKIDMKPNDRVKLGFTFDMSMQKSTSPSLNVDPFQYAYFANPYERPFNSDGSYAADNTYFALRMANGAYDLPQPPSGYNIFREMDTTSSKSKNFTTSVIGDLDIRMTDNLSFEGMASYGYVVNNSDNINGKESNAAWNDRPFDSGSFTSKRTYGSITQASAYNTNYNLRGQLHYFNTFKNDHYISVLLGSEIRGQYSKSIYEKRYGYDPVSGNSSMPTYPENPNPSYSDLLSYAAIMDALSGQSISEDAFASFYFSMDYVFKQRYVASLTMRTDGSNNFGSKEQFNPTGSFGLSWNIDQEPFMKKFKPIISSMSMRTAFGYTGNINKSVYPQLVMDYESTFRKTDTDYYRMGSIRNAPNPRLRWEKNRDMKVSLDVGLFNERIHVQGELYDRRTSDAVTSITVPSTTGFSSQSYNTSELLNQGAELSLSAHIIKSNNWNLSASANLSYNRNKLLKFNSPSSGLYAGNYVGYPLGSIFSGKMMGIDRKLGIYTYQARPDAVFSTPADRNNADNYLFYLGTSTAPTNGGYSINLSYKRLSINMGGSYSFGGKVLKDVSCPVSYSSISGTVVEPIPARINDLYVNHLNVSRNATKHWTPDNPITNGNPRIIDAYGEYLGLSNYMVSSSVITNASMMQSVSYFKLGSISLGYSLKESWIKKFWLSSLSLSVTMNNIFILTNYKGLDPETPGAVYPMARTYSMGISIGF